MQIKTFSDESIKLKVLIYGNSGVGKTTFASTAPSPVFACIEKGGLLSVKEKKLNYVDINTYANLIDFGKFLKQKKHDFNTVLIDSITELNEMIKQESGFHVDATQYDKLKLSKRGTVLNKIKAVVRAFCQLDMNVIFLAQDKKLLNDKGEIKQIEPRLNGQASKEIIPLFDIVGYMMSNGQRKIYTNQEKIVSKDRTGVIGNTTDLDFSSWLTKTKK